MAGTSVPPLSVSSLWSSALSTSSTPRMPKKQKDAKTIPMSQPTTPASKTRSSSIIEEEDKDGEYTVMTTTTIVTTTTTQRSVTPQPQSPSPLKTSQPGYHFPTPSSSPLKGKGNRSSVSRSSSTTPDTRAPFLTPPRYSYTPRSETAHSSRESTSLGGSIPSPRKKPTVPVFGPLRYYIPSPAEILPPAYRDPPPKTYYVVTVGQDVGVFDDWLLVAELIHHVTGQCYKGYKTWDEALVCYAKKHKVGAVVHRPHPGSRFNNPIPDWEDQEFEWDSECEDAAAFLEQC
ncbi:hypothetical protein ARMSODRAFT_977228 [Armillaria solidipes]|uniref:Ribonuclease H1 N-terminal domain-containing protein n=1 Tax=Armillaria solidipes TaxID=1076256 RepID=A0A2H3BAE2_9AGAR|nr:hypothetical protein ARMSODRAFT_977228 [Armillaria solidipes]